MAVQVLLVDNEANRRRLLERRLSRRGFDVRAACTLAQAVAQDDVAGRVLLVDLQQFSGPDRAQLELLLETVGSGTTYLCRRCGRTVRETVAGRGSPACCGGCMERIDEAADVEQMERPSLKAAYR